MSTSPFYEWWSENKYAVRQTYFNRVIAWCPIHGVVASARDYSSLKTVIFKMKAKIDVDKLVVTLVT